MAQRSTKDALLDMAGLGSGQAEAAPWASAQKLLKALGPKAWQALDPKSKAALEMLTEQYPAVKSSRLLMRPQGSAAGSAWKKQWGVGEPSEWAAGTKPSDFGAIIMQQPRSNPYSRIADPSMHYAHEGSHVFSGPLYEWAMPHNPSSATRVYHPARAAMEGFAEGSSHGMLNRYLTGKYGSPYWSGNYRGGSPYVVEPYTKAGYLGKEVGKATRAGEKVDQTDIIETLMRLVRDYMD